MDLSKAPKPPKIPAWRNVIYAWGSGGRRDPPISSSYRCLLSARWPLLSWQWGYPAWWYGCTKPAARGKPSPGPSWPLPRH